MRFRYLGLFALAPLAAQCQPACAPTPPPPPVVETTTTAAPTTTQVTTTTAATTTTTAPPVANPLNIRWDGFACDESQTMSGWSSFLAVVVRHDGSWDAPVDVVYESQDGSLVHAALADLNPGEPSGYGYVMWPRVSDVYPSTEFHTFRDSTRVRVSHQGHVILEQTFTLADVKAGTPACAAVIDTPGS